MTSRDRVLLASTAAALLGFALFACRGSTTDGPSDETPNPEPLFRELEADLITQCGGANGVCHVNGTYRRAPRWLGGPDPYVTIKRYRGILPATKDVGDSLLLTQVRHEGPSLADAPDNLFFRVSNWLSAEVPGPPLPTTGAFSVQSGYNSVPLDAVASGLTGARITFLATDTNGTLTLSALKLVAPANANVTIESPFFVILPKSGKVSADPDSNGFKGELTAPAGVSTDLFTGKMILLRWSASAQMKIVFAKIASTPGRATPTGCTALDVFESSALPAMSMPVEVLPDHVDNDDGTEPIGKGSCLGCHAKEPPPNESPAPPVQAMDLRAANTDPAAACAQAKLWVNLEDRSQSTILLNPTGKGNPVHPIRPLRDDDPIITGIRAWVEAEE